MVAVATLAFTVADAQHDSRAELRARFADRVGVAASFVGTYVQQLTASQSDVARRRLAGARVSPQAFADAVSRSGMGAAVLLDRRGRALHVAPANPAVLGSDLGRRYPHLRQALGGRAAVSPVVRSAARREPIVAFAVPFDAPGGRRVFSAGYAVGRTPLGAYLKNALALRGGRMTLLDEEGTAIASHGAVGEREAERGGRHHVTRRVDGTPWQITMSVPRRSLYAPVGGASTWVPWFVLLALSAAGLIAALLLARLLQTRRALREDIRRRTTAERSLSEAEQRFRQAFELAPIGMAMVSIDGTWLRVNRALCQMLAYRSGELIGITSADLTHPDDLDADLEQIDDCMRGDIDGYATEKRFVTARGDQIVAELSVSLARDGEGRPLHFLSQVMDVTERRRAEGRLAYLADHDPLTGLLNRRRFGQELERQVAYTERYGHPACLLMLDLDHFKHVNDSLGHAVGDELIVRVANALTERLRTTDLVARLGGDEFAVLLPETTLEQALGVGRDLVALIRRHGLVLDGNAPLQVTASIGVAGIEVGRQRTAEELLIDADIALYDAKDAGRATVALRDPDEDRSARPVPNVAWAERIRSALEDDGFVLYQQPIQDLSTDQVTHHEILLRMVGDDGEHIAPGVFLYVAERFGLITEIDMWVVRRSIQLIADQAALGQTLRLAVNLSGASLTDTGVIELIEREIDRTGIDPRLLTFEITETAAISNIEQARRLAQRLAALGCRFALDDFGAGFGSFYYLKHLQFDVLKIDGEFVRALADSPRDQLLVRSIADLARQLGSETVAEFVGDEPSRRLLREYGVSFAQGYLIGRPMPVSETWPAAAGSPAPQVPALLCR